MSVDPSVIHENFKHHPPRLPAIAEAHGEVRRQCEGVAQFFNETLPGCREAALAQTKLEEAMMWANAAIARKGLG